MYRGLLGSVVVALGLLWACGGATGSDPGAGPGEGGAPGSGGHTSGGTGGSVPLPDGAPPPDAYPEDVTSDYVPPTCPDAEPPPVDEQCDLFAEVSGCDPGLSCFPYVEYPDPDDECAEERYGTECLYAGWGRQGDPCTGGDCAANHICVLTGDGTTCLEICATNRSDGCPAGLVCEPIDAQPGVGGCY